MPPNDPKPTRPHAKPAAATGYFGVTGAVRLVPVSDLIRPISVALIDPLAFTSFRKLEYSAVAPESDLAWLTSEAVTAPLALTSPTRMLIGIVMSLVLVPLLTPNNVTAIVCPLATPVRLIPSALVPLPAVLATLPVPVVIAA